MPVVEQLPVALGPGATGERIDVGRGLLDDAHLGIAEEAEASFEDLVGARDERVRLGRKARLAARTLARP